MIQLLLITALLFTACAPLSRHDSILGDAGEVIGRTLLCPVTFCISEIEFKRNYDNEQKQARYARWYESLPDQEKNIEDMRQAHRYQLMGQIMQGRPLPQFSPLPMPNYAPMHSINEGMIQPRQRTNCTTNYYGSQSQTICY